MADLTAHMIDIGMLQLPASVPPLISLPLIILAVLDPRVRVPATGE